MKSVFPKIILVSVLSLFVGTIVFLYKKSSKPPVVHQTVRPVKTDIINKTVATGAIVPRQEIEIKPRVSGVITKVHVEPGTYVKEGDLIVTITIVPDIVKLNSAEAAVREARINLESADRELKRNETLFKQNMLSQTEHRGFVVDFQLKRERLGAALSNLQLIKSGASKQSGKASNLVRSTVEGMVIDIPVREGGSVIESNTFNAGTTVAYVANMADMIFQGKVDESEVGKIKEGMKLEVTIGAIEGLKFDAKLEYIAPKGVKEEGAIQFEVRAAMAPRDDVFIRAGYSANADIVLDRRKDVLAIEERLLQFDKGKTFVEVKNGSGRYKKTMIKTGLSDGIHIEVLSGLSDKMEIKVPLQGTERKHSGSPTKTGEHRGKKS